jgi:hypothetical protein
MFGGAQQYLRMFAQRQLDTKWSHQQVSVAGAKTNQLSGCTNAPCNILLNRLPISTSCVARSVETVDIPKTAGDIMAYSEVSVDRIITRETQTLK